ncbi:hypothetical protein EZI54_08995 [Marinobacter halodurans]|uniref:GPI inositol-deacylase PGAP1-like alpha/beta domain-containing protein n=2 Tax=Marinobacter halodurans TaxID=2528979 RepID=A0ABY1ZLP1_9GAMM|nr:hypothetical protein EZI54_08995 [Marinobacter halodurans]
MSPLAHWQHQASAILSGLLGDWLARRGNPLAVDMQFYRHGQPLAPAAPTLDSQPPRRSLILLIHGLTELESIWDFPGQRGTNYATALCEGLGGEPLSLRYNTGCAIPDNGRALARQLDALVAAWPVPVENLVLIGHSMGGLLIRSACHYGEAAGHDWIRAVDSCVYLGSPHDGAWLARLAQGGAGVLQALPRDYLKAIGDVIDLRSVGIRNLNQGQITDRPGEQPPLLATARHYAICGLLGKARANPANWLFGDALVHEDSARGKRQRSWQLTDQATFAGVDHIRLAHHPAVLEQLEDWLQ